MASIASWADDYRELHKKTTGWHFVNIPLAATNFDDTRDCTEDSNTREGDCIIHAIVRSLATLSDTSRKDDRVAALKFLVHFIGDLHQPLHAVGELRGYNQMPVCYFSGPAKNDCIPTNLHAVWDAGLIHSLYYDWGAYVDYLESSWMPQQDVQAAVAGNPRDWALQSHEAARAVAVSNTKSGDMLGTQYLAQVRPTLDRQLGLAGLRLASLLNAALSQSYVRAPKALVISLFAPEADPWIKNLSLVQRITVPGLSPDFPDLLCNADDVCLLTTGMGHTNAAASTMVLLLSGQIDLRRSYVLIAGIAGIDPSMGTLGSAAWARYLVDFGLQNEIDAREKPANWTTGYLRIHAADPSTKPVLAYKTEVFQLDEQLLQKALKLSSGAQLMDSDKASTYRLNYPNAPANQPPKVIQCDTLAGDTYWHGNLIGERAHDWVLLLTDGKGAYCTTQQEDNAIFEALKRGAASGLVDLRRVADLGVAANFDRPYPDESADTLLHSSSGGFPIACENIYRAGLPLVQDIVSHWSQWETGVPP